MYKMLYNRDRGGEEGEEGEGAREGGKGGKEREGWGEKGRGRKREEGGENI